MTDEVKEAPEASPEVVQPEAEQPKGPEAANSTEGQPASELAAEDKDNSEAEDKKPSRWQRKNAQVARLRDELDAAGREATEAKARADEAEAELQRFKSREKTPPREEDFNGDYDAFNAARTAHLAAEILSKDRAEDAERDAEIARQRSEDAQRRRQEAASRNWQAQLQDASERYADFDDVVLKAPADVFSQTMAQQIAMSEIGADVAYHLGMNRDQAREIARMDPSAQVGAIRVLEQFVSTRTPQPKTETNAPDPVNPVTPKATGTKDPGKMSMEEYKKARSEGKI